MRTLRSRCSVRIARAGEAASRSDTAYGDFGRASRRTGGAAWPPFADLLKQHTNVDLHITSDLRHSPDLVAQDCWNKLFKWEKGSTALKKSKPYLIITGISDTTESAEIKGVAETRQAHILERQQSSTECSKYGNGRNMSRFYHGIRRKRRTRSGASS